MKLITLLKNELKEQKKDFKTNNKNYVKQCSRSSGLRSADDYISEFDNGELTDGECVGYDLGRIRGLELAIRTIEHQDKLAEAQEEKESMEKLGAL